MKVVADLHLHSKYSRAVSPQMIPSVMAIWAVKKGIDLLGTTDWTHPLWLKELEANLEETGEGIYKLRAEVKTNFYSVFKSQANNDNQSIKASSPCCKHKNAHKNCLSPHLQDQSTCREPSFILSTEISSIYSQGGKVRRIHNLMIAPSFKTVYKINNELKRRGCNLLSDGRPIIGLSSMDLCELVWSQDEDCIIIPCHVWTPWFSLYGSKSGFDSIDECFGKYASKIYAVETGLSSDPAMNWRIKDLDTRSIVSFSDAHSPAKMGRELTVFELEKLNYQNVSLALRSTTNLTRFANRARTNKNYQSSRGRDAVNTQTLSNSLSHFTQTQNNNRILYTIEFHPEEGKYHYTGHRNCGIKQTPEETMKKGTTCPVCGRPLTVGVMHRVQQLASSEIKIQKVKSKDGVIGYYNSENKLRPPYIMLVPLMEIIAESYHTAPTSQKVINEYENLTKNLGSELKILTQTKLEEIEKISEARIAEGIQKVRIGDIVVDPGYDGVFGVVKIWNDEKEPSSAKATEGKKQMSLL